MGNFELPRRKGRGRGGSFSETGQFRQSGCAEWLAAELSRRRSLEIYYCALVVVRGESL